MTGFGAAVRDGAGRRVTVEAKSVNHRFLKSQFRLPLALQSLEPDLETEVRTRLTRGAITVSVHVSALPGDTGAAIDEARVRANHDALLAIYRSLYPDAAPPEPMRVIEAALRQPGGTSAADEAESTTDELRDVARRATVEALDALTRSRDAEGAKTASELRLHGARVATLRAAIAERSPLVTRENRDRFATRVNALLSEVRPGLTIDDTVLMREAAAFGERCDVSEELQRLAAHLDLFNRLLDDGADVGRRLDFLLQEMLREANTIGSKASDLSIAHSVVEAKAEIDKMKEQVQNLE